jgi:glucose/arabinose dehydrogenase
VVAEDGRIYVNERGGRIRLIENGELRAEPLAEIPTTTAGETGLLGLTLSPDGNHLYAFATDPAGSSNRVLRVPRSGGTPEIVVEDLPAELYHNGGGVAFAPDGSLLISNGENHDTGLAQDPSELGGKVYRFTADGDVPDDNPFGDSPTYALGLRNPYGMTIDPVSGAAFVTENGPDAFDEVNRIDGGGNLGWPDISGPAGGADTSGLEGDYADPVADYPDIIVPTGIAFADPKNAVREYAGDLFFGTYGQGAIHRLGLNDARDAAVSDEVFIDEGEPVVALAWGPEGLYYSTTSAVKVVPIARSKRGGDGATSEMPSPSPAATDGTAADPASDDRSGLVPRLVIFGYFYRRNTTRRPPI